MTAKTPTARRCPTCGARQPSMHPAVSGGGEVTRICPDSYHDGDPVTELARARAAEDREDRDFDVIEHRLMPGFTMPVQETRQCETDSARPEPHLKYRITDPDGNTDWLCAFDVQRPGQNLPWS